MRANLSSSKRASKAWTLKMQSNYQELSLLTTRWMDSILVKERAIPRAIRPCTKHTYNPEILWIANLSLHCYTFISWQAKRIKYRSENIKYVLLNPHFSSFESEIWARRWCDETKLYRRILEEVDFLFNTTSSYGHYGHWFFVPFVFVKFTFIQSSLVGPGYE